jgi:hypothetical protein
MHLYCTCVWQCGLLVRGGRGGGRIAGRRLWKELVTGGFCLLEEEIEQEIQIRKVHSISSGFKRRKRKVYKKKVKKTCPHYLGSCPYMTGREAFLSRSMVLQTGGVRMQNLMHTKRCSQMWVMIEFHSVSALKGLRTRALNVMSIVPQVVICICYHSKISFLNKRNNSASKVAPLPALPYITPHQPQPCNSPDRPSSWASRR